VKKKPRSRSSGADNYSELEDGVEWYEEEKCSAEQCKRPKNKRVKWVIIFLFLLEVGFFFFFADLDIDHVDLYHLLIASVA
jgi:hypothetical protein